MKLDGVWRSLLVRKENFDIFIHPSPSFMFHLTSKTFLTYIESNFCQLLQIHRWKEYFEDQRSKEIYQGEKKKKQDKVCHQVWSTYFELSLSLSLFSSRKSRPNFSCRGFQVYGATKKRHDPHIYSGFTAAKYWNDACRKISNTSRRKCCIKGDAAPKMRHLGHLKKCRNVFFSLATASSYYFGFYFVSNG